MKAPLKFTLTLTDADGKVKATSTFENLEQADVVTIQGALANGLLGAASAKAAEHASPAGQAHKGTV